ncbi:ABC-type transport auxiliary lipoprotein family protein [Salinisphaera sp. T31B1]|uniref:PqiC family protein n=1 Tax=Salinisphaera sp. T31B1 TaxID=727963 RepID=UPI00333F810D
MKPVFRRGLVAACLMGLSACASVPPLQHVLLSPPQNERAPTRASQWEVRRVQMPEYLDNYDIQLRTDEYVLTRLPDAKWAERLPVATTRLLQQTIDEKLVNKRDRPYQVDVAVDMFEPQPEGKVVLSARWKVTDRSTDTVIERDNSVIEQPLPANSRDAAAIGRAMSEAVRQLGFRIVSAAG